ncbi:MAG TPA: helix-turn-helix domain-containing protein, partial [Blastocatellia bacterium]|nr:helix-turn-helix domain-containing protein [Blastocatellia bacterium]
ELEVTQESVAHLLGVRRAGVTLAASSLRERLLIGCRRGHIAILNRAGLEETACECYGVVKNEYHRLLG